MHKHLTNRNNAVYLLGRRPLSFPGYLHMSGKLNQVAHWLRSYSVFIDMPHSLRTPSAHTYTCTHSLPQASLSTILQAGNHKYL